MNQSDTGFGSEGLEALTLELLTAQSLEELGPEA
jgi:hypothetical protein